MFAPLLEGLQATPGVRVWGPQDTADRTPTVAFTVDGRTPDAVAADAGRAPASPRGPATRTPSRSSTSSASPARAAPCGRAWSRTSSRTTSPGCCAPSSASPPIAGRRTVAHGARHRHGGGAGDYRGRSSQAPASPRSWSESAPCRRLVASGDAGASTRTCRPDGVSEGRADAAGSGPGMDPVEAVASQPRRAGGQRHRARSATAARQSDGGGGDRQEIRAHGHRPTMRMDDRQHTTPQSMTARCCRRSSAAAGSTSAVICTIPPSGAPACDQVPDAVHGDEAGDHVVGLLRSEARSCSTVRPTSAASMRARTRRRAGDDVEGGEVLGDLAGPAGAGDDGRHVGFSCTRRSPAGRWCSRARRRSAASTLSSFSGPAGWA